MDVLYANLSWAALIGETDYTAICRGAPYSSLSGERLFAAAAFDLPLLGQGSPPVPASHGHASSIDPSGYWGAAEQAGAWADELARRIVDAGYRVVGCTCTFEQTLASVALLRRVKSLRPEVITILGGGNCQGVMADGLADLCAL